MTVLFVVGEACACKYIQSGVVSIVYFLTKIKKKTLLYSMYMIRIFERVSVLFKCAWFNVDNN